MPRPTLRNRILETMRLGNYRPMRKTDLANLLGIDSDQRPKLRKELSALESEGVIVAGRKGHFEIRATDAEKPKDRKQASRAKPAKDDAPKRKAAKTPRSAKPKSPTKTQAGAARLRGNLKFTPKGDAWFFADNADADNQASGLDLEKLSRLYVPRTDAGSALNGDRVLVSLILPAPGARTYRRGKPTDEEPETRAKVEEIIERRSGRLVGTYVEEGKKSWVKADDLAVTGTIDTTGDTTAQPGQMVVVQIDDWDRSPLRGRIIEVLGWPDEAGVDILSIIHRNGIRTSFPDEVLAEARAIPGEVDPAEAARREDWRDRLVVTIDPADAKDKDDAIWVEKTKTGWQLAVHIADVSHYVKPGTAMDKEAIQRGNSTYLVDRVIPMLPVELSNGICSLTSVGDRLTKCAVLDVNKEGKVVKSRFCNALIRSQAELSYEQAQDILDGKPAPKGSDKRLRAMIKEAWAMAATLRKLRFKIGALDLEMPEIRVKLDDKGHAAGIEHVEHTESHQLVEECMLAANESVARILKIRNKPTMYRIHEDPDASRLLDYGETAKAFGYNFGDLTNKAHIQQLLDAARGKPDEHAIKIGLLKSLKRAVYAPNPLGHYGLSKENYCHFTSPIRRYADLIVHRCLQPFLDNPPEKTDQTPRQAELADIARHISDTERASAESEGESKNIKLLDYLDQCSKADPPVVFQGLITEVRSMGLMVEATDISTRGVIKREDLPDGPWRYEQSQARLSGKGGRHFQMGQRIQMEVARIDHERRFVDFMIAGEPIGDGVRHDADRRTGGSRRSSGGAGKSGTKGDSGKSSRGRSAKKSGSSEKPARKTTRSHKRRKS